MQLISVLFCSALLCMRALIFAGPAGRRSPSEKEGLYIIPFAGPEAGAPTQYVASHTVTVHEKY